MKGTVELTEQTTRVLVVDDSALYRQTVRNVLRDMPETAVVGIAKDGVDALKKIEELDPDLLTLDVQMPDMDGIQVLKEIKKRRLRSKAIMLSSLTAEGAQVTTDALMEGAFDFILKPSGEDSAQNRTKLRDSLQEKIAAFRQAANGQAIVRRRRPVIRSSVGQVAERAPVPNISCKLIVIGTSTGGPAALKDVLPKLPRELSVPVIVVQHMPPQYTKSLADRLDRICPLEVKEATSCDDVVSGRILIAPGGQQMKLERSNQRVTVRTSDDPPEHGCRPSIDYLLRSAISTYDGNLLAVIMTGMGRDGWQACGELKQRGGFIFAQDEASSVVYGMPKAVIDSGLADRILPLGKIAPAVVRHSKRSTR